MTGKRGKRRAPRAAISGARIFDGWKWHDNSALLLSDGKVEAIVAAGSIPEKVPVTNAGGGMLVPGFVDLQVNGGGGVLFNNSPDIDGIARICAAHATFGTTALLPTLITDTPDISRRAMAAGIAARKAAVPGFIGLHLEGPHLSVARKGTHDPALIRPMTDEDLDAILAGRAALGTLVTTIAPESVSLAQVASLAASGVVVSLGHTDASCALAKDYMAAGAKMVTHLFNAMSPLGHREPGLVGAALDSNSVFCGLIADGFHVDPVAMGIAMRARSGPGRIFLVTDAMSTIGTDDDGFELNGRRVYRREGRLTLADGTLAGADIDMLSCVRFMHARLGVPLSEALRMASTYPAQAIGHAQKGGLRPGQDADFVLLSPDLDIRSTWIGGQSVFSTTQQEGAE